MADLRPSILEAATAASRVLKQFAVKDGVRRGPGRVDVFALLESHDIPLVFRPLNRLLGAYLDHPSPGVLITTRRPLAVQRFTAAHELGHAVMGHRPSLDDEGLLGRSPFAPRPNYDVQEVQADVFAAELLMPRWLVSDHMEAQRWTPESLSNAGVAYQLSLRLGTSYAATCWMLERYRVVTPTVRDSLLATRPRDIKRKLAEGFEPDSWHGDVWVIPNVAKPRGVSPSAPASAR